MIRLLVGEWNKLWDWKIAKRITCLILLGNWCYVVTCLTIPNEYNYTVLEKATYYQMFQDKELTELEQTIEETKLAIQIQLEQGELREEEMKTLHILEAVYEEIASSKQYASYLEQVQKQAGFMKTTSVLGGNAYTIASAQLVEKQYKHLVGMEVTPVFSDAIVVALQNRVSDSFIFIILLLWILCFFVKEQEDKNWYYIRLTHHGIVGYMLSKLIVIGIMITVMVLLFYGGNILIAEMIVPSNFLEQAIQGIYPYVGCPYVLNGIYFLGAFLLLKILGFIVFSTIVYAICMWCREYGKIIVGLVCFFGIEAFIYYKISDFSVYAIWKEINIFSILNIGRFFTKLETINCFGYAISNIVVYIVAMLLLCILNVVSVILAWKKFIITDRTRKKYIIKAKKNEKICLNLFVHEAYKLYVKSYAIVGILCLIVFQYFFIQSRIFYTDEKTYYYQIYSKEFINSSEKEKENYFEQEYRKLQEIEEKAQYYLDLYENGAIGTYEKEYFLKKYTVSEKRWEALEQANKQNEQIKSLQAKGYETVYLDQTGWNRIFGEQGKMDKLLLFLVIQLVLIVIFSDYCTGDYKNCMHELLFLYKNGDKVLVYRWIHGVLFAVIISIMGILPWYFLIFSHYGMELSKASIKSIELFVMLEQDCSIAGKVVLDIITYIGMVIMESVTIYFLAGKTKNKLAVMLLSAMILILQSIVIVMF